jgi:predicted 3-demethylubiquinone-9 3-methyltransferase (glyoxalase superfamily)
MERIYPCLWFDGGSEEAAELYKKTFKNSREIGRTHYTEASSDVARMSKGAVMTIDLELAGRRVQILNGGPGVYEQTSSTSLFVMCGSKEEVDAIYKSLSPGGKTLMELGKYPFSERYAFFADKFGVHWQVSVEEGKSQRIAPCIIFGGAQQGSGPRAKDFYLSLFKDSTSVVDVRYGKDQGGKEGSLMFGHVQLDGSDLLLMDSGGSMDMKISGGISLVINCKNQAEVDRFWDAIAKCGQEIQCGWIADEFGIQWQVVPEEVDKYFNDRDPARTNKAFQAMLQMKKLDIEKLKQAYNS